MELHCKGETNKIFFTKNTLYITSRKKYQGVIWYIDITQWRFYIDV